MCSVRDFLLIGLGVQYSRDERHDALSSSLRSHGLQDQQLLQRKQPAPKTQEQAINHPAWTTGQDGRLRGQWDRYIKGEGLRKEWHTCPCSCMHAHKNYSTVLVSNSF